MYQQKISLVLGADFLDRVVALNPDFEPSEQSQFRLRLLKFTITFVAWSHPGVDVNDLLPDLRPLRKRRRKQTSVYAMHMGFEFPDLTQYLGLPLDFYAEVR